MENDQLKPTLLFFRHRPEALVGDGTLTSSLQSLETSFLLISLSRFPHALTACFTAIETAIRASGVGGKRKINLLSFRKRTKFGKIAKYPRRVLEELDKTRNRFIHQGFTSKDDTESTSLILEAGLPFLWLCYKELHSFDAATDLRPEYWEQLDAARRVHSLAKQKSGLDLSYCFNGFKHLIRWSLRRNFSSAWEIGSLVKSEETGEAFAKNEKPKDVLKGLFAAHWSFDCPICDNYQAAVCEIDTAKLWEREVVLSRMECVHCGFAVRQSQPFLSRILLENKLTDENPPFSKSMAFSNSRP